MKKGLKKPIALLLSAMMIFSTSNYEFYNSESEITVTTCDSNGNVHTVYGDMVEQTYK